MGTVASLACAFVAACTCLGGAHVCVCSPHVAAVGFACCGRARSLADGLLSPDVRTLRVFWCVCGVVLVGCVRAVLRGVWVSGVGAVTEHIAAAVHTLLGRRVPVKVQHDAVNVLQGMCVCVRALCCLHVFFPEPCDRFSDTAVPGSQLSRSPRPLPLAHHYTPFLKSPPLPLPSPLQGTKLVTPLDSLPFFSDMFDGGIAMTVQRLCVCAGRGGTESTHRLLRVRPGGPRVCH
jgi:hypothetical protein